MRGDYRRVMAMRHLYCTGIVILLVLLLVQYPGSARAAPALTISPAVAPCSGQVTIAGAGFDPASRVGLLAAPTRGQGIEFAALTVQADGTFRTAVSVVTMIPQCRAATPPQDGALVTIYAVTPPLADKSGAGPEVTLATATLTLSPITPGLPNTGGGGMRGGAVAALQLP